jgi:hypothetical protein
VGCGIKGVQDILDHEGWGGETAGAPAVTVTEFSVFYF